MFGMILEYIVFLIWCIEYCFFLIFYYSKYIYLFDDFGEMIGFVVRSYVIVEWLLGGK